MNQATESLNFAPLCRHVVTAAYIPRHVMHLNAWGRPAGRLQDSLRIPVRRPDRMSKKPQVLDLPRQRCPLRVTNQRTILKVEPR
jgi:hypothetical protein